VPRLTPEQRAQRGRIGAYRQWSQTPDRAAHTEPARRAFLARFENEVDPDGTLDPATRAELAAYRRKEYFTRLAFASARARAAKKGGADATT
jgi:hypothetical protein